MTNNKEPLYEIFWNSECVYSGDDEDVFLATVTLKAKKTKQCLDDFELIVCLLEENQKIITSRRTETLE